MKEAPSLPMADGIATGCPLLLTMVTGCDVLAAIFMLLPFSMVNPPAKAASWKLSNGISLPDMKLGSSSIHSAEDSDET